MERNMVKITLICPKCSQQEVGWLYDTRHLPFYVTPEELESAGGYVVCEFCDTICVEVKDGNT